MPDLMVVLPTYNETENLPLITETLFALPVNDLNILVVDDNSPDGTGQLADELAQQHAGRLHVLHRTEKSGLGPAYIAGFRQAIAMDAGLILQMDADFSHQPKYIPDMIARMNEGYDMVCGSRYAKGGSVDESWSFYRKLLSTFANRWYVRAILNIPITDATAGFRLWRRETLIGVDLSRVESNGYVFQVEMAYIAHKLGYKLTEIPIYFPDRKRGQSKMDIRIQREAAVETWRLRSRHGYLTPQMRKSLTSDNDELSD